MYTQKKRRFSPLLLIGAGVTLVLVLIAGGFIAVEQGIGSHAAAVNMNCTLIVPPNPLTAQGLATPYQLTATVPANGPCNEANTNQSGFVQAAILNTDTGQISAYEPLVIDAGTQPAIAPMVPTLPANAVVGIWFGSNANIQTLIRNAQTGGNGRHTNAQLGMRGGLNGNCVNGTQNSPFGQFSYCNAVNFFRAANRLIAQGKITVPALGTSTTDGQACPSTRSFSVVDMDQSDNVQTQYLVTGNGTTAQFSAANQAQLANATPIGNPSDNALISKFVDPALGCTAWMVPDMVNTGVMTATLATDELQAAAGQQAPIALVPGGDPMTLVNGAQNLMKTNLYRLGVDQTPAASLNGNAATSANTTTYCQNLVNVALPKLQLDMGNFQNHGSPDGGATANSLFTFLANRLNATLGAGGLNCVGLLNIQQPITLTTTNGIVTNATITTPPAAANGGTTTTGTGTGTTGTGTTGTGTTTTTSTATGMMSVILDPNAGNAQVAINVNITNAANTAFFANITDSATGKQVLHQMENTDGNGANAASTVINGLQGVAAIPATWTASITDANGNMLASAPVVSNGTNGTATFAAAGTTTNNGNGNNANGNGNANNNGNAAAGNQNGNGNANNNGNTGKKKHHN